MHCLQRNKRKVESKMDEQIFGSAVHDAVIRAVTEISADVKKLMKEALERETNETARSMLSSMLENVEIAKAADKGSIEKAPSAELRPGQKDSDSLPEYALLDKVLAAYIEHAHGRADLLADGFDQVTVDTVMRLVDRAEWKRRQYPLGPKVTALAFGRDRRLPVTNAFRE